MLTDYYEAMQSIVDENEGTGGEFIGDGLLAFWNSPDDVEGKKKMSKQSKKKHKKIVSK